MVRVMQKLLEQVLRARGPYIRLHPEDRALLEAIHAKLDVLLTRTAPEASVVAEIRRRVTEAIDGIQTQPLPSEPPSEPVKKV